MPQVVQLDPTRRRLPGERELARQRKRLVANRFANASAANALNAHTHGADFAARERSLDVLKVGGEATLGDPGDLGTDTAQVLCFTACFYLVANRS